MFKSLQEAEMSEEIAEATFSQIKRRKALSELSEGAFKTSQGFMSFDELKDFINKEVLVEESSPTEPTFKAVTSDLEELLDNVYKEEGSKWRLQCLNKSLGSLRDGDFGFIFARPETGKTTLLASESSVRLNQKGNVRPIVWFNNEEQGEKVMLRVIQSYFGLSLEQLFSNVKKYNALFKEETKGKFILIDDAGITKRNVEKIIDEVEPGLVIYDQLPKIKGFAADRDDLRLGAIFQWARELAKSRHAAIGVSQADGSAEGVRYLTMEHVANSKTAVQAEADWILGIGKSHDIGTENVRYLSISKNKLLGDRETIEDLRHGRFEVIIKPSIARYEDVINYD